MKKLVLLVILVAALAVPVLAQGPFNDVPTDHWAYDAVNSLQQSGIIIGYPDGTFGGRRAMSRYEFAVAIARMIPMIGGEVPGNVDLSGFVKTADLPDFSTFATKADLENLKKLVDEFRDELAALGVDVDNLKCDVAALSARVDALEAENERLRFTGLVNVFAIASNNGNGELVDLDNRTTPNGFGEASTLGRTVTYGQDFDLNLIGKVSDTTAVFSTINYGNYLNYLVFVDDYVDNQRPTSKNGYWDGADWINDPEDPAYGGTLTDTFFPYYLYINSAFCGANLTAGRFPLQFTPYTLKKIDVDAYTNILKTDDGMYPVDGIKVGTKAFGVDMTFFAVKNDTNTYLKNGLTGQPNAGLFDDDNAETYVFFDDAALTGNAAGGLDLISQTAGARFVFGTPWKGTFGATYYQGWSAENYYGENGLGDAVQDDFDQVRVYGADYTLPIGQVNFVGSWTESNTLASQYSDATNIRTDNQAYDGKFSTAFGKLGVAAGYKYIQRQFAAAGAWDKIGRWTNPVNVKGPYANAGYQIARNLNVVLDGEYLIMIDDVNAGAPIFGAKDDEIIKGELGVRWGVSKSNSLELGYEWIKWAPKTDGLFGATETYATVGWASQLSANAGLKVAYQFINYNDGATESGPYLGSR